MPRWPSRTVANSATPPRPGCRAPITTRRSPSRRDMPACAARSVTRAGHSARFLPPATPVTRPTTRQAPDHATLAFSHSCEQCHTTTAWRPSTFSHTEVRSHGGTCRSALLAVSHRRDTRAGSLHVLLLSHDHLPAGAGPCHAGFLAQLRAVPHDHSLAAEHLQSHGVRSHGGTCRSAPARDVTPAGHSGRSLRPATLATRPIINRRPNHAAQAFPHTCEQCHSTAAWLPTTYQHTSFPVDGGTCRTCLHPVPYRCARSARFPRPAILATPPTISRLRTMRRWPSRTVANSATRRQRGGRAPSTTPRLLSRRDMAVLRCSQCHTGGALGAIPSNCYSCHTANYQAAPDHATLAFSHSCEQCHTTTAWRPSTFHHTGFALTAGHAGLRCSQCHTGGTLGPVPSTCYSCHTADYQRGPSHAAQAFPHTCEQCHNTTGWLPATYQHTSFPLTAGHAGLACTRCHTGGTFGPIPSTCYSCHATRYQQAANHAALAFSHSCEQCHTTTAWLPSTFRHTSGYDSHRNATCTQCHTGGNASSFNCLTCHTRSSTDGDHKGRSGYTYDSPACYRCHPRG